MYEKLTYAEEMCDKLKRTKNNLRFHQKNSNDFIQDSIVLCYGNLVRNFTEEKAKVYQSW